MAPTKPNTLNFCSSIAMLVIVLGCHVNQTEESHIEQGALDDLSVIKSQQSALKDSPPQDSLSEIIFNWLNADSESNFRQVEKREPASFTLAPDVQSGLTTSRKARSEGGANKLNDIFKNMFKMEDCLRLGEGHRFRKRSARSLENDQWMTPIEMLFRKRDSQHRLRSLKNMC